MIKLTGEPVILDSGALIPAPLDPPQAEAARCNTMASAVLRAHSQGDDQLLRIKFDALVSPDNNYVSILQTFRAGGGSQFALPWVLTNCHNTLCATGGTINEDDHRFGFASAQKYGGVFLPPYRGVIHQYMREQWAGCGRMILGSDSHTRYGALGTLGIGEGGGEVAKAALGHTYDLAAPQVVAVWLAGAPRPGIGPMDVALTLIGAVFSNGFVKNKILEFIGPGVGNLSMESRIGIDVMSTETGALSSIWQTDEKTLDYLAQHGRAEYYRPMTPGRSALYDAAIHLDLSEIEPMIALPFHPSNVCAIRELNAYPERFIDAVEAKAKKLAGRGGAGLTLYDKRKDGRLVVGQALISGCAGGTFENIAAAADILQGYLPQAGALTLGINPASMPVEQELMRQGIARRLALSGGIMRPCICGPCFGVTDIPANNTLSIRHVTRNYPLREGSKPDSGQLAAVALMDARSIAATVRAGGLLTAATELEVDYAAYDYRYDQRLYTHQVFNGWQNPQPQTDVPLGPNIADWPAMPRLGKHLLLEAAGVYDGSITTDDLIPSGEASSYRSNPERISDYLLIHRDPDYRARAKSVCALSANPDTALGALLTEISDELGCAVHDISVGSLLAAPQIGDGSSREQAASCQKVLGGWANLVESYATKRYRSNLINWGILPLCCEKLPQLMHGDRLLLCNVSEHLANGADTLPLRFLRDGSTTTVSIGPLTGEERRILLAGCVINHYQ